MVQLSPFESPGKETDVYRILVVDDELPVASGIAHIIKRDFSGVYELAGIANSGREAVEKAIRTAPDIILMDVKMPGFSGLEAIREIKVKGVNPSFIMITAYERFEIAREALELGVVDYLLKPVAAEALALSLKRAEKYLENRDKLEKTSLILHELKEECKTLAAQNLIYSMVLGTLSEQKARLLQSMLDMNTEAGIACAIYAAPADLDEILNDIQYKTSILAEKISPAILAAFIPIKNTEAVEASKEAFGELDEILKRMQGALRGFGSLCQTAESPASWEAAIGNLNNTAQKKSGDSWKLLLAALENELADSLQTGKTEPVLPLLEEIPICARASGLPSESEIGTFIALVGRVARELRERSCLSEEEAEDIMRVKSLCLGSSADMFAAEAERKIGLLLKHLEKAPGKYSRIVADAMSIVHNNYAKPLSLESVADAIGISPGRLSRLFAEETGQGFSRYLVMFRIDQAKKMLERPGASVKEVSAACGYPDQNYFARLFKKLIGTTPTAYMSEFARKTGGAHENKD